MTYDQGTSAIGLDFGYTNNQKCNNNKRLV